MGLVFDEASYRETLEMAVQRGRSAGVSRAADERRAPKGRFLGIGFATFSERTGYGSPAFAARGMEITPGWETVELTMDPSGLVEVRIGSSPHGQGLRTTLAQIIADEIGVEPQQIRVVHGDTDRTPYGWGTFASRSLVICRRRLPDRGAEDADEAAQAREPSAGGVRRRHRARRRHGQGQRHRSFGLRSRRCRAPPIIRPIASRARSSPA